MAILSFSWIFVDRAQTNKDLQAFVSASLSVLFTIVQLMLFWQDFDELVVSVYSTDNGCRPPFQKQQLAL